MYGGKLLKLGSKRRARLKDGEPIGLVFEQKVNTDY
jgi:hypothetical protein